MASYITEITSCNPIIAEITLSIIDIGGFCSFEAQVTSGTTADILSFDVSMDFYSAGGCAGSIINTVLLTTATGIPAPSSYPAAIYQGSTYPVSTPVSGKFASPIVVQGTGGPVNVTTPNQIITIGGNSYKIIGFQNCFSI